MDPKNPKDQKPANPADTALEVAQLKAERDTLQRDLDEAKKEIELLQQKAQEESPQNLKELAARAQADLQNAKDRLDRQASEIRQYALEQFLLRLLPTLDNFQRAFGHLPPDLSSHEWVKGVLALEQDLLRELTAIGLKRIESLGKNVDPQRHEVLQSGPGPEGVVTQVFEEGYEYNGKALRPAKVMVGNG